LIAQISVLFQGFSDNVVQSRRNGGIQANGGERGTGQKKGGECWRNFPPGKELFPGPFLQKPPGKKKGGGTAQRFGAGVPWRHVGHSSERAARTGELLCVDPDGGHHVCTSTGG